MKTDIVFAALALAVSAISVPAQAADPAPAAAAKFSSKTTSMNALLADPAAKAVLMKHIPQLTTSTDVVERAGGMTLAEIAEALKAYSPDSLSDAVLAKIDADLAAIPAH